MSILSEEELKRIISWQPYKSDWPVDRNLVNDNIQLHFGDLLNFFKSNNGFNSFITEDGGISNYLEILCYPIEFTSGSTDAIMICISLCAPIFAYGQVPIEIQKTPHGNSFSSGFYKPEEIGIITNNNLKYIEEIILIKLAQRKLTLLQSEEASIELSKQIYKNDRLNLSLHEGNQLFHAIFQVMD